MQVAYIWASALWQISVLFGGAAFTYKSGNGWWVAGAIILVLLASTSLDKRVSKWEAQTHINHPKGPSHE